MSQKLAKQQFEAFYAPLYLARTCAAEAKKAWDGFLEDLEKYNEISANERNTWEPPFDMSKPLEPTARMLENAAFMSL